MFQILSSWSKESLAHILFSFFFFSFFPLFNPFPNHTHTHKKITLAPGLFTPSVHPSRSRLAFLRRHNSTFKQSGSGEGEIWGGIREGHLAEVGGGGCGEKREKCKKGGGENWRGSEEKGESGSCWGRWKLSAYKVAIRGKVALCEARGTSVPITAAHKRPGGEGGGEAGERPRSPTWAGPHQTPQAELHGPIWGFQRCSSLAFEKARQEPAQWVTHGSELESDLRAWRRWKAPSPHPTPAHPPTHPTPGLKHLSGGGLLNGTCCGVISTLPRLQLSDDYGGIELRLHFLLLIKVVIRSERKHCILSIGLFQTYMTPPCAPPSNCHKCTLRASRHWCTASIRIVACRISARQTNVQSWLQHFE